MKVTLQLLASTIGGIVFMAVLLFVPAGTVHYWQAWVFIVVFIVGTMVPTVYLAARFPDALSRRMTSGPWNETRLAQKLIYVALLLSVIALGVISALDHRFGWSTVPAAVVVVGNLLVLGGLLMAEGVVIQNNYAAATITVERDQPVVSTGLYGIVRHPMYVGALIMMVGMPLALASYWGLLAVVPGVLVFAARIVDEEKALRADLDGYDEYTEKVQYRLLPGVW
ncbi:MAG: methyltransferase family protein [Mycobacterium sp.]